MSEICCPPGPRTKSATNRGYSAQASFSGEPHAMVSGWCCQRRQPEALVLHPSASDATNPPRPMLVDTEHRSEHAINNWQRWTKKLILIGKMRGYWHDAGNQETFIVPAPLCVLKSLGITSRSQLLQDQNLHLGIEQGITTSKYVH